MTADEFAKTAKEKGKKCGDLFVYQDERVVIFQAISFVCFCVKGGIKVIWKYYHTVNAFQFEGYLLLSQTEVPDDFKGLKQDALEQVAFQYQKTSEELCELARRSLRII